MCAILSPISVSVCVSPGVGFRIGDGVFSCQRRSVLVSVCVGVGLCRFASVLLVDDVLSLMVLVRVVVKRNSLSSVGVFLSVGCCCWKSVFRSKNMFCFVAVCLSNGFGVGVGVVVVFNIVDNYQLTFCFEDGCCNCDADSIYYYFRR